METESVTSAPTSASVSAVAPPASSAPSASAASAVPASRAARAAYLESRARLPSPDRSPIYAWARRHIKLVGNYAVGGNFNVDLSPWLIPVFDALQNDRVRTVTLLAGIQVGKTLVSDMWIPWLIVNDPGPITYTMHTDDVVGIHAKTRLNPILDSNPTVSRLLPRPGPYRTITEIYFGGFSLILNAANLSDQQSQSVRYKINDELWHPKWQSVYADAIGRVTKYEEMGISKVLNITQAGFDGDDSATVDSRVFRAGHMGEWSARCPSCSKLHPVAFSIREADDPEAPQLGGAIWDPAAKGEDDLWNVARAMETTRFRCPHCGRESPDTDATRELWKQRGEYVTTNPRAPETNRSFHVESITTRPMTFLVEEWLNARNEATRTGNEEPMQKFRQKREAKPWRIEKTAINLINIESTHTVAEYAPAAGQPPRLTPNETLRAMTVDRQLTHFWVEIGAWSSAPEYTHMYFSRVDTIDQVRALQQRYGVPDSCVGEDRRGWPNETDKDCARYGWRGLMGVGRKTWAMENPTTKQIDVYPHSDPKYANLGAGVSVPFYEFSADHMKDILFAALNKKGFPWRLPKDVNPLYLEHLKSEAKEEVRPGVWRWVEIRQNANHGIDTSAMMLTIAIVAGIVRFKLDEAKP